jgi:hypothetical protein
MRRHREIGLDRQQPLAARADPAGRRGEVLAVAVDQGDGRALLPEELAGGLADPTAAAGHQRYSAAESPRHRPSSRSG